MKEHFTVFDWNPTVPAAKPDEGGRFDATKKDRFSYIYAALASKNNPDTAVAETLWSLTSMDRHRRRRTIPRAVVNARALQYFKLSEEIVLADLRIDEGLDPFGATSLITTDPTRNITRQWCRYIRASSKDIQGLAYNSTTVSGSRKSSNPSVVLFRDRLKNLQLIADSKLYSFGEGSGRELVNNVLGRRGVLIV